MTMRTVSCCVLKQEAEALDEPPYPGELGIRIYQNVSKAGWAEWLNRLQLIVNEYQLNTAESSSHSLIEQHMMGFLFGEGDFGKTPDGFHNAGR